MKQYKKIGLDNRYNTSWKTLGALVFMSAITSLTIQTEPIQYIAIATAEEKEVPREVQIITTTEWEKMQAKEKFRQEHLAKLRYCESSNDDGAIGDAGESLGPYQWQKPTLEDKLGRKVTNKEWILLATDYEFIHELTYKTYFEDGEWWRWYNCSIKLGYQI